MSSQSLFSHILSQTRQNIEFLIAQNQITPNIGQDILQKLPHVSPTIASSSSPPTLFRTRALWSYNPQGQDPNDLSFHAGDVIDITAETNADWWMGSLGGRQGIFPSNYVERLPPSASATPLPPPAPTPYAPPSYGGPDKASINNPPAFSSPYPSYQPAGGYQPPPPGGVYNPYGGPTQPQPPPANAVVENSEQPPKKGKFGGKFGNTLAHSAVGGVGFGAGSAVGSGIINSIF